MTKTQTEDDGALTASNLQAGDVLSYDSTTSCFSFTRNGSPILRGIGGDNKYLVGPIARRDVGSIAKMCANIAGLDAEFRTHHVKTITIYVFVEI